MKTQERVAQHVGRRALADRAPAIVLGGAAAGLGAMRSFGQAGIPVFSVASSDDPLTRSRWYRSLPGLDRSGPSVNPAGLAGILNTSALDQAVLCPCSDHWTAAVSSLAPSVRNRFPAAVANPEALATLQDKARFAAVLVTLDVPHPTTLPIASVDDLAAVPPRVLQSAFLKPCDSQAFSAIFNRKAVWLTSRAVAEETLQMARSRGLAMLLQEYVPGGADRHVFVDGYRTKGGEIAALFARRRLRMFSTDFGNSTKLVSIPLADVDAAVRSLRRVLEGVDYRGIFSAEFKLDPRDNLFQMIEINTRPWLFVEFAARCGVDVCTMAYRDAVGEPVESSMSYRIGAKCFTPVRDFHALRASKVGWTGYLQWALQYPTLWQPFGRLADPGPGLATAWSLVRSLARKRLGPAPRIAEA